MDKDSNEFDAIQERTKYLLLLGKVKYIPLGHVNSIPTMQFELEFPNYSVNILYGIID